MHDFGMLCCLVLKMLWLTICSLFYRRIVRGVVMVAVRTCMVVACSSID